MLSNLIAVSQDLWIYENAFSVNKTIFKTTVIILDTTGITMDCKFCEWRTWNAT